ncbi:MAG: hypothetical protein IT555_09045 [Acetobacteraceae bacterium]|nr:hypothetical protein [Acetobacteraceae bacterium]
MPIRLMFATALALTLGAAATLAWPEAPAERVATRAEMIASHADGRVMPASAAICLPIAPRASADI